MYDTEFYDELESSVLKENFIWYCNRSKKAIPGVKQVMIMVSNITEYYDEMIFRLNRIENKMNESCTELMVDHKIDQALHDFEERELRKNNLILYNLPESTAETGEAKKEEEAKAVGKICECLDSADIPDDMVRIGERKTENGAKPRPVKVTFNSESIKRKILTNSKKTWGCK